MAKSKQRRGPVRVLLIPEPLVEAARTAAKERGTTRNAIVQEAAEALVNQLESTTVQGRPVHD